MSEMSSGKRIAKNTLMLYFRQILIMLVSLYTVRVVLHELGVEDYGIHNVVTGVVTLFSFLSNSMASASQRYFSYYLGRGDFLQLKKTFSLTITIYIIIALIVILLAETIGLWFLNNKLVIPADRIITARWIYQFSVVSFVLTIMTAPFMASIIAHEDMNIYAYVSVFEVLMKLVIAFLLRLFSIDKLFLYGLLLLCVTFINTTVYRTICKVKYKESIYKIYFNKNEFIEMIDYFGWNLLGVISNLSKVYGVNILLNVFFGPVVNAARGIAFQVSEALRSFANNFSIAIRPQIVKTYSTKQYKECMNLVFSGSKACFFLLLFFTLPIFLEAPYLLTLWLKNVPEHAVFFTRLMVIDTLIDSFSYTLIALMSAHGKLMLYQIVVSGITLLNLPISYLFLKNGGQPEITMFISICISIFALFARVFILSYLTGLQYKKYIGNVLGKAFVTTLFALIIPSIVVNLLDQNMLSFVIVLFTTAISLITSITLVGLTSVEKNMVKLKISTIIRRGSDV